MLEGIIAGLPAEDVRRPALAAAAEAHKRAGLAAVTGEHYEGGHWLGSFCRLPHHGTWHQAGASSGALGNRFAGGHMKPIPPGATQIARL